jgi:hypothetical protein
MDRLVGIMIVFYAPGEEMVLRERDLAPTRRDARLCLGNRAALQPVRT